METARDLGRVELWQESLERSLARRGKLPRSSLELSRLRPDRDLAAPEVFLDSAAYWQARRREAARRAGIPAPVVGLGGLSAAALLAVTTLPSLTGAGSRTRARQLAFAGRPLRRGIGASAASGSDSAEPMAPVLKPRPARPAPRARTPVAEYQAIPLSLPSETATSGPAVAHPAAVKKEAAAPQPTFLASTDGASHAASARQSQPVSTRAGSHHAQGSRPAVQRSAPTAPRPVSQKPAAPKSPARQHRASAKPRPAQQRPAQKPPTHTSPSHKPAAHKPPVHKSPGAHHPAHHSPAPSPRSNGYVNPLAHASVTPERIDQGVDYSGTGTLTALGSARVTYVATSGSGWPGAFIQYQLLNGPDAGRYVYYAEGVKPAAGVSVGRTLRAGQAVASLIPGWSTGIEIGWGAGIGSETLAAAKGEWSAYKDAHDLPTAAGKSFSALIASLGGPPGR